MEKKKRKKKEEMGSEESVGTKRRGYHRKKKECTYKMSHSEIGALRVFRSLVFLLSLAFGVSLSKFSPLVGATAVNT